MDSSAEAPTLPQPWHWEEVADPDTSVIHAVPHNVVSQILRPEVALFLPPKQIKLPPLAIARTFVKKLTLVTPIAPSNLTLLAFTAGSTAVFPNVTTLCLSGMAVTSGFVFKLTKVPTVAQQLRSLDVRNNSEIDSAALAHVGRFKQLEELDVSGCSQIESACLFHISTLKHLRALKLRRCRAVSDDGVKHVENLTQLRSLDLNGCLLVTSKSMNYVSRLRLLQELDLSDCPLIDATGVALVSRLVGLELHTLKLEGCTVDAMALASLRKLWQLRALDLSGSQKVNAAVLHRLQTMSRLT